MKYVILVLTVLSLQGCALLSILDAVTGQPQIDVEERVELCPDGQVAEFEETLRGRRHTVWFKCVPESGSRHRRTE